MPLKPIITLQLFDVHQNDPVFLLWYNRNCFLIFASKNIATHQSPDRGFLSNFITYLNELPTIETNNTQN